MELMNLIMRILLKNRLLLVLLLFVVLASVVARSFWGIPAIIVIVTCHYIIPGIALQKLSGCAWYSDYNKLILSSFAVGYALSISVYTLLLILGLHKYVILTSVIISLLSLIYIWRNFSDFINLRNENTGFVSLLLFLCLGISFVGFQLSNLSASILGYQNIYQDLIYWFRNAVAATISYPLPDLSVMDKDFYYHYFSSLGIADAYYISGVDLYNLCFTYSYIFNIPLVVGSVYLISSELVKNKLYLYVTCVLILFGTTIESITFTDNLEHLYYCSFGFAEGFALSLYSFYFYKRIFYSNIFGIAFSLMIFAVAVGAKAPVALVVLMGIICDCLIAAARKKHVLKSFVISSAYLVTFVVVVFLFVIDINPQYYGAGNGSLSLSTDTIFYPPFFNSIYGSIHNVIPFAPIPMFIVFLLYIMINSYAIIAGAIILWRNRIYIDWKNTELSFLMIFVSGYVLFLFLSHSGFSQVYFYFAAIPFGYLYIMSIIDLYGFSLMKSEKILVMVVVALMLFCFSYSFVKKVSETYNVLYCNLEQKITGSSITSEELEALSWVRENVDKTAILISNKYVAENGFRTFVISAYTEHQTYMEGYFYSASIKDKTIRHRNDLLVRFFANDKSVQKQLQTEGVTHVVLFKNIQEAIPDIKGKVIYENSSVAVYALS